MSTHDIYRKTFYKDIHSESQLPYHVHLLLAEVPWGTQDICRKLAGVTQHSQKTCTVEGTVGHPAYPK